MAQTLPAPPTYRTVNLRWRDASAGAMAVAFQIDRYAEALAAGEASTARYWRARIGELLAVYDRLSAAAWPNLSVAERRQPITRQEVIGSQLEAVGT